MQTVAKILGYTIGAAVVVHFITSSSSPDIIRNALDGWTTIVNAITGKQTGASG